MRFHAEVGGRTVLVEVMPAGSDLRVRLDGTEVETQVIWVSQREVLLRLGARQFDLEVLERGLDRYEVLLDGRSLGVRLGGAATAGVALHRAHGGRQVIEAPMPGKVVAILVKPGDRVEEGQGLVVVEAMKMENELRASAAGVVQSVHARPGQVVEGGVVLIELGPVEPEEASAC